MKRALSLLLLIVMLFQVFALTACNKKSKSKSCEHTWNKGSLMNAEVCGQGAKIKYTCTKCNETKEQSAENHSYTLKNTISPTCVSKGYSVYTCTYCNHEENRDYTDEVDHSYIIVSEDGSVATYNCEYCSRSANRYLLPMMIEANEFEKDILTPMMDLLYEKMCECFGAENCTYYFESVYYDPEKIAVDLLIHRNSIQKFTKEVDVIIKRAKVGDFGGLDENGYLTDEMDSKVVEIAKINDDIRKLYYAYYAYNPNATGSITHSVETIQEWGIPAALEGKAVYKINSNNYAAIKDRADIIKSYCPGYTFDMMHEDEAICGYIHDYEENS